MTTSLPCKLAGLAAALVLSACGGGGGDPQPPAAPQAVGGTVSGLDGVVVLQANGGDDLAVSANGTFRFATPIATGATYAVSVRTQPSSPAQTCAVAGGSGTVGNAPVTGIAVACTTNTYRVGASVSNLVGSGLVLQNNGGDDRTVLPAATSALFATEVPSGSRYAVGVKTQPTSPAQTCVVGAGSGTVGGADVSTPTVTCTTDSAFVCGTTENGTVVTHGANIAASETWAGAGTVHVVANPIVIQGGATVTIQPCAIVKLAPGAGIDVRGDTTTGAIARLVSAGTDPVTGRVVFTKATPAAAPWGRIRGLNGNSIVELGNTVISGGGSVGGAQLNAVIAMTGSGTLPDPVLKVAGVTISAPAGAGIYLSNAAFASDSRSLAVTDQTASMIAMPAMALGSVPPGTTSGSANPALNEIRVVENANVSGDLTIATEVPIRFASGFRVGALAPTFVADMTLTLEAGVTLKFERGATLPAMVIFGDGGQTVNKNAALVVRGTAAKPVRFTSAEATPAPGDWAGLWLRTSNRSQIDHAVIEYAGADASIGPRSCGPFDASINQRARHTAPLLVGNDVDQQYVPPAGLLTNTTFRRNTGNFAIDSVWQAATFAPVLTATNVFGSGPKFCTQSKNLVPGNCVVNGVDQSGCLVN